MATRIKITTKMDHTRTEIWAVRKQWFIVVTDTRTDMIALWQEIPKATAETIIAAGMPFNRDDGAMLVS